MLRTILFLLGIIALPVQAEEMYKCINAAKEVTYTNQPCGKLPGMKEAKTIEADPGPPVPPPPKPPKTAAKPETKQPRKTAQERAEAKRVLKAERAEKNKCDKISDQISQVMDKMDAARHRGYTAKQEAEWNDKIRELNAKKSRLNCF